MCRLWQVSKTLFNIYWHFACLLTMCSTYMLQPAMYNIMHLHTTAVMHPFCHTLFHFSPTSKLSGLLLILAHDNRCRIFRSILEPAITSLKRVHTRHEQETMLGMDVPGVTYAMRMCYVCIYLCGCHILCMRCSIRSMLYGLWQTTYTVFARSWYLCLYGVWYTLPGISLTRVTKSYFF